MIGLCLILFAVIVIAYTMIDGRNVTIRHLRGDLDHQESLRESVLSDRDSWQNLCELREKEHKLVVAALNEKLAEKDARVHRIVDELSHVQWRRDPRDHEAYNVTISVNPRLFGGIAFVRDDLLYIAKHIGDQVAYELASYKYIEKANETERRYR